MEIGRWENKPREERICKHCETGIEDLTHFIIVCPYFQHVRNRFQPFPYNVNDFFMHNNCSKMLLSLHTAKEQHGHL